MKSAWLKYDEEKKAEVFKFAEGYKKFISECKTERECVARSIELAEAAGYVNLKQLINEGAKLEPGQKVYAEHMGKTLALFCIGKKPIQQGMNILGAHVDSPRLDLKQHTLYEDNGHALLDTHYYGGIKKYQWVALPLALHGVVAKKDGSVVEINIGENDGDPVFGVTDLLVHLSANQLEKKGRVVVEGEDLDISIGNMPVNDEKESVKKNILNILKEKYNIEEDDLISAELEAVPAGSARDYGLDQSMIMGYGQDDRSCAYPSLLAMFDLDIPETTAVCLLVDKEEIGSVGATGMHSKFFENTVAEVMNLCEDYSELKLRRAMQNSKMLSSDVSAAFDPTYSNVMDKNNSAFLGCGLCFNKFTGSRGKSGSNDANAEYMAYVRAVLDEKDVSWQTCELGKVDQGGGGTIAYIMANYGMQVIDSGVAVLNMHAPWEVTSKADIYEALMGYKAFLEK